MNNPAAPAKVSRPQLRNVYPRTRLFKQLDQGRKRSVVWITGPPGAGKTTLVNSYIERRRLPCLWFQCDEGDADPATFFHYLGVAAEGIAPRSQTPLSRLTPEYALSLPTFARNFFRELCGRLTPPFVVVFDNYQEVPTDADLHALLSVGFEEIPGGAAAVVVSRDEPPAPLARLQVNQVVDRIGWDALRLTQEESAAIVRLTTGKEIADAHLAQLQDRTQGWLAGVILLAAQPGKSSPDTRTYETAAPQLMFDYFAGEVFSKANADTQRLLLRTAFLPHVSVKMARILTGLTDATQILGELNTRRYFTDPIGQDDSLYRYHPLFQAFLQARSEELAQLLERSASLLAAEDQIEPAIELLLEANAWEEMARLIGKHAPRLLAEGRNRTLEGWLDSLPVFTGAEPPARRLTQHRRTTI
jgi:ATP/maltotriose-dependent transcriptional regulator MalT